MRPMPKRAPTKTADGIKSNMPAINSIIPVPTLPQGSTPNFVNNSTDSGCPVNLKYKVCKRIAAPTIRNIHESTNFNFKIFN